MPLFLEVLTTAGDVSATEVAQDHKTDLGTQSSYGVSHLRYWVSEPAGKIFCLVEADDLNLARTAHREAHRRAADEIYRVSEHV